MPKFSFTWQHFAQAFTATAAVIGPLATQAAAGTHVDIGTLVPALVLWGTAIWGIFTASAVTSVNAEAVLTASTKGSS